MAELQSLTWDGETIESALRSRVSPVTWQTWFAHLSYQFTDNRLRVIAPSEFHVRWVREKHAAVLNEAAHDVFGPDVSISFSVDASEEFLDLDLEEEETPSLSGSRIASPTLQPWPSPNGLACTTTRCSSTREQASERRISCAPLAISTRS